MPAKCRRESRSQVNSGSQWRRQKQEYAEANGDWQTSSQWDHRSSAAWSRGRIGWEDEQGWKKRAWQEQWWEERGWEEWGWNQRGQRNVMEYDTLMSRSRMTSST